MRFRLLEITKDSFLATATREALTNNGHIFKWFAGNIKDRVVLLYFRKIRPVSLQEATS